MDMPKFVRTILLAWFVIVNLIIIICSIALWANPKRLYSEKVPPSELPPLPIVALDTSASDARRTAQISLFTQQVDAYKKHIDAYNSQLTAYSKYLDAGSKYDEFEAFRLVVKDTLVALITSILVSLFGFAFAKTGLEVYNNYIRVKNGKDPEPLSKFF